MKCPAWSRADKCSGRVVLIGDAAHGFLPSAGLGASMALESAVVLAEELARVARRNVLGK